MIEHVELPEELTNFNPRHVCDDVNTADVLEFPLNSNVPEIPVRPTIVTGSHILGVDIFVTVTRVTVNIHM